MSTKYSSKGDTISFQNVISSNSTSNVSSSDVQVKTSLFSRARQSWLTITFALIAIAGILGTVGVSIVAFVILPQTSKTSTTSVTESTITNSINTTSICFTIPSPRPSNNWYIVDTMSTPRQYHTSTYISEHNFILIAGGSNTASLITTEKYIPSTGCFQSGINMVRARRSHTADILSSFPDYVLLSGGYGISGVVSNVVDLFNPITGYTLTISLSTSRYSHGSAVFGTSRLVLIGGIDSTNNYLNTGDATISGLSGTFYSTNNTMTVSRIDHTVTRLGNNSGIVLIAGGYNPSMYHASTELYYGASNIFFSLGSGGSMPLARAFHTATYLPPPYNKVLITGGCYDGWNYLNTMILFDVATLSFTTISNTMSTRRSWHTATLLPNGKVLIVGGHNNTIPSTSCDLIDPANNYAVTPAGNLNTGRYRHTATLIPDSYTGTVLICGGTDGTNILNTCELYVV